ncbi:tripartite tricarboxylate transporter TctB family protein [Salininema proteolyticum]|uniref:Tripartite tricarboxylate transporter TctB family protein n=1 Tax=Salininema proteolyticum TaxID=1607685 RepID=A0ABV8U1L7_9ACTN
MSTVETDSPEAPGEERAPDKAQYGVCALLVLLAALVAFDTSRTGSYLAGNDVIGPRPVPYILAGGLLVFAVLYALDVKRGGRGDDAADVRLDWRTIGLLCAVFAASALLMDWLGWVIAGGLLYFGSAVVLGTRRYIVALVVAAALALATFYGFAIGLGVGLPAGILQGIL